MLRAARHHRRPCAHAGAGTYGEGRHRQRDACGGRRRSDYRLRHAQHRATDDDTRGARQQVQHRRHEEPRELQLLLRSHKRQHGTLRAPRHHAHSWHKGVHGQLYRKYARRPRRGPRPHIPRGAAAADDTLRGHGHHQPQRTILQGYLRRRPRRMGTPADTQRGGVPCLDGESH